MGRPTKPTASSRSRQFCTLATPASSSYTISPVTPTSPPPLSYTGSPYACIPLPPVAEPSHGLAVVVHPCLMFSNAPPIVWEVSLPCGSTLTTDRRFLTAQTLSEPATNPPLPTLTIVSYQLPEPITVYGSSSAVGAYVTVSDVLNVLYRTFQAAVTPTFNSILSCEVKGRISASHTRGGNSQVVKMADYLAGRNLFMGLSSTRLGHSVWARNVS